MVKQLVVAVWLALVSVASVHAETIRLKRGSGYAFAAAAVVEVGTARDLWWNGSGLVPDSCGYSLGVMTLDAVQHVDAGLCEFAEFPTTVGEVFAFGITTTSARAFVVFRVAAVTEQELTLDVSERAIPSTDTRFCPFGIGTWSNRLCACSPLRHPPPELAIAPELFRYCKVGAEQIRVAARNGERTLRVARAPSEVILQGDIRISVEQRLDGPGRGSGRTSFVALWPGARVPYTIDPSIRDDPADPDDVWDRVQWAINHWNTNTPIRLEAVTPRTKKPCGRSDTDCVTFRIGTGCDSHVGRVGGQQFINLTTGCPQGSVAHEIGHAIGMFHQQSAETRDRYVTITGNVQTGEEHNFDKFSEHWSDGMDYTTYDYGSIMHYPPTAFSANGQPTIVRVDGGSTSAMGQRTGLSQLDRATVEAMYGPFAFSYRGPLDGKHCLAITEPDDPHPWHDNYFCSTKPGAIWSSGGPMPGMRCINITEPGDVHSWADNHLCVPMSWDARFTWSTNGPRAGQRCIAFHEPDDPDGWDDNYLCWTDTSRLRNVTLRLSDIDDDAYVWIGDRPGDVRTAVCAARIDGDRRGSTDCDLTGVVVSSGLQFDQRFVVKFGNGGGFDSSGRLELLVNGRSVLVRSKDTALRHTGWFYRIVLLIDFVRGTVRIVDEKRCNDIIECAD